MELEEMEERHGGRTFIAVHYFQVPQHLCRGTFTYGPSVTVTLIISEPVIGQTVQKLVSRWLRMGAMFRKRIGFFTVQVCTNWFSQIKLVWAGIKTIY
jgi:hypothetical protein